MKFAVGKFLVARSRLGQTICKPGSVRGFPPWTVIPLGRTLPFASSNQPGRLGRSGPCTLPCAPSLFGLAPGGVCRAASVTRRAVRSYRTLSPLPFPEGPDGVPSKSFKSGGLLSVALSLGSPPPGVTRHRYCVEPGLSSPARLRSGDRPMIWPKCRSRRAGAPCQARRRTAKRAAAPSGVPICARC